MLPTWTAEQPSHGSALVPVAQIRPARTTSPTRDRAKAPPPGGPPVGMTALPQGAMAAMAPMGPPGVPNVSGVQVMPMAPVMVHRVKAAPVPRTSSPDRRYF